MNSESFVITSTWTVYDQSPAMFPSLTMAMNGDILLTFCTTADGLPGGKIYLLRSSNRGTSWSSPCLIANSQNPNGAALNSVGMTTLKDGTIILPYNDVQLYGSYENRTVRLYILHSYDDGFTWSGPVRIASDIYEPVTYGKILELNDGTLLLPIWGRCREDEKLRSGILISHDKGESWGDYRTIAYDPKAYMTGPYSIPKINGFKDDGKLDSTAPFHPEFRPHCSIDGFSETFLAHLPNDRIMAIIRQQGINGSDRLEFYRAVSKDSGKTWSTSEGIGIYGMSPCLHWSPNGCLLLAYRRRVREGAASPEYGVSLNWSEDYGTTWKGPLTLVDPKGISYTAEYQSGYPSLVNIEDLESLVIFYSCDPKLPFRRYLAANVIQEVQ